MTELSKDSTFQEQSKWREGIPDLPAWQKRAGKKRSYSKVKKPGKDQRKRRKLNNPGKPGSDPVPGPSFSVNRDSGNPGVSKEQASSGTVVSRKRARSRTKKTGRILSYDEIIEGEDATSFLDDPDFRFEVPEDVENIELL